jgi:Rrf2 family iron-sulfur cluster assembly transcriptional regulator
MFRLSRRADYALRTGLELAAAEGERLTAQQVAKRGNIPLPFLRKVVADLVGSGLVNSQPGPGGGLALARPASEVSVLDVVEAIEGAVCLNACLLRPGECPRDRICPAHGFWGRLQALVVGEMRAAKLDALAKDYRALRRRPKQRDQVIYLDSLTAITPSLVDQAGGTSSIPIKE